MNSTISDDKIHHLKNQLEYYLSDDNLTGDKFFHEMIKSNPNGYLDFHFILNCNKVKKLGVNREDIANAVKLSTEIELDPTESKVRRKDNKELPELKLLNKKRNFDYEITKEGESGIKYIEPEKPKSRDDKKIDPLVLSVESTELLENRWKSIQDEFRSLNPHLEVVYARFKQKEGHFIILKRGVTDPRFTDAFDFEGISFTVKKCEGEDLINFWKDHGSHYEMCVNKNKRLQNKEEKKKSSTLLKEPLQLGEEVFIDIANIKSKAKNLLSNTKEGDKLCLSDEKFILDLLKYHSSTAELTKDINYITTGKPKENEYSKCFMLIQTDGKVCDVSVGKCLDKIKFDNKKKRV